MDLCIFRRQDFCQCRLFFFNSKGKPTLEKWLTATEEKRRNLTKLLKKLEPKEAKSEGEGREKSPFSTYSSSPQGNIARRGMERGGLFNRFNFDTVCLPKAPAKKGGKRAKSFVEAKKSFLLSAQNVQGFFPPVRCILSFSSSIPSSTVLPKRWKRGKS